MTDESIPHEINQDSTLHESKTKYNLNARLSLSQLNPLESVALNGPIQEFGLADTIDFNANINFPTYNGTKKVEEVQYKEPLKGDEEEVDWETGFEIVEEHTPKNLSFVEDFKPQIIEETERSVVNSIIEDENNVMRVEDSVLDCVPEEIISRSNKCKEFGKSFNNNSY